MAILEPYPVPDIYSDGIAHVDNLGNCFRTTYYTWSRAGGQGERVAVAKIVRPISSVLRGSQLLKMIQQEPILGMLPELYLLRKLGEHNGH